MEHRHSRASGRSEYFSCDSASSSEADHLDTGEGTEGGIEFTTSPEAIEMGPLQEMEKPGLDLHGTHSSPAIIVGTPSSPSPRDDKRHSWGFSSGGSDTHLSPDVNHATVTSMESFENLDHEALKSEAEGSVDQGLIRFGEKAENGKCCRYISATNETPVDLIAHFMSMKWKMRTPKVILSVISGVEHSTVFNNSKVADDFQKGLIKAANSTVMWVLTDGIDYGVPKLVGDAVAEEMGRRKLQECDPAIGMPDSVKPPTKLPKLTVIGVLLRDIANRSGRRGSTESFTKNCDMNPNHTHFLLLDGTEKRLDWVDFRNKLEDRFLTPVGRPRKYRTVTTGSDSQGGADTTDHATPMVAILVQGGLEEIDHTLNLLKRRKPVLVIKGSGYAADLVAFAYEGVHDRNDPEHIATSVKPELMRKVGHAFPSQLQENDALRTTYRDKIMECVGLAHDGTQTFLTVVDVTQWDTDLLQLSKYILQALFKSEKRGTGKQLVENILRDLQLTVDWNLCDLAESAILERYSWKKLNIENYLFEQALMQRDREEFVGLFLKHGFQVHKYLNHKRLQHLFENAEDLDLFYGVCLQKVLGKVVDPSEGLDKSFLEGNNCQLNRLLLRCTNLNNLVNPYELSMNSLESYVSHVEVAERKAMNTLVMWSALTNKIKLTKLLWQKVDDPIPMALLLSNLFTKLSKFCSDRDLRNQLRQYGVDFGKMAVDIFDLSYLDSPVQALGILSKRLPDYDNRSTLEIAFIGHNRVFIAHKCCQRWLNQRWYGMIVIRELDWGLFTIPPWLKIYMSAFMVFPMYVWLSFIPPPKKQTSFAVEQEPEEDETEKEEKEYLLKHLTSIEEKHKTESPRIRLYGLTTLKNAMGKMVFPKLPLHKQLYYLWNAPITKFWVNQLFYMAFLLVFTMALILPTCGNLYLDLIVFTWTGIILVEVMRTTFVKKRKYPEMTVVYPVLEIILIITFLGFYLFVRIIPHFVVLTGISYQFTDYQSAKFVMSLGLLYFYYRLLAVSFPISPTLGPMLINIKRMIKKDFFTWFRMFLLFMISGAITIQAVIYPNYPFTWEMLRKAFSRALFALFLTQIHDLEGDPVCTADYPNATLDFCGKELREPLISPCPYGGNVTYLIVIQYLFIVKLVLVTLLFAMFSSTISKISAESQQIWKFQRYNLIVEFEERLRLPPPLTLISYLFMLAQLVWQSCLSLRRSCARCCRRRSHARDRVDSKKKSHAKFQGTFLYKRTADFNYWKKTVKEYTNKEDQEKLEKERPKRDTQLLHSLIEDMSNQKKYNRKLNDRLGMLEKGLTSCLQLMEEAKHMIEKMDPKAHGMTALKKEHVHIYSRQSPYPDTSLERYPVLDKFVPWEIVHSTYDPSVYTKPVAEFHRNLQKFVDVDVLRLISPPILESTPPRGLEDTPDDQEVVNFRARWNAVCTAHVDNVMIEVDRTSWITENGRTCRYRLDKTNLPQNPKGRTGVRGRGSLWRWGPNHSILGVVTRCKTKKEEGKPREHVLQDGKKILEFITIQQPQSEKFELPGGIIHGETSPYSLICELFMKYVLHEEDVDSRIKLDKEDMIDFFSQFSVEASYVEGTKPVTDFSDAGFTAEMLYRGYMDDTHNTDNAWLETEVWNFHYEYGEDFSSRCQHGKFLWQDLSSQTRLHGNQLDIILEVAKIHNAHH
ncbi:transient receptor potential cation channel subfamily M member 8-like [Liolophura sinensis]|uniref:transient receptor potential cation channel subfamily M member 8-like n=1 Tax=Liolophura sinensis TaxID=3198878 RepID=UPI00315872D6